jgi:nitrile hydratase subunit beta
MGRGVSPVEPRFEPGDPVLVLDLDTEGHVRTPRYVRGRRGWISAPLGRYPNPESLAYGGDGLPERTLYKVGFRQRDLWPDYEDTSEDVIYVDVYEHWLRPEEGAG